MSINVICRGKRNSESNANVRSSGFFCSASASRPALWEQEDDEMLHTQERWMLQSHSISSQPLLGCSKATQINGIFTQVQLNVSVVQFMCPAERVLPDLNPHNRLSEIFRRHATISLLFYKYNYR